LENRIFFIKEYKYNKYYFYFSQNKKTPIIHNTNRFYYGKTKEKVKRPEK